MQTKDDTLTKEMPSALWVFLGEACHLRPEELQRLAPERLPQPDRSLLVHNRDMTSTLATFHRTPLRVTVLQQSQLGELYLREVFLISADQATVVEYGVIAIALEQFSPVQQAAIQAGKIPLGGLLHEFGIQFESKPTGFFSVSPDTLTEKHRRALGGGVCYGRFNRLTKPTGEPLAWIMEILPRRATD